MQRVTRNSSCFQFTSFLPVCSFSIQPCWCPFQATFQQRLYAFWGVLATCGAAFWSSLYRFHVFWYPLKHFTLFFTPQSSVVNMFAQSIACFENAYVFPPFTVIGPVLKFLFKLGITFSIVVWRLSPLSFWWPVLFAHAQEHFMLGRKGESGVLLFPSSSGNFATCYSKLYPFQTLLRP